MRNEKEDEEIIKSGKGFQNKEKHLFWGKQKKIYLISKQPIRNVSGESIGIFAELIDITPRYNDEHLRLDLQTIMNHIDIYVWAGKGISYDLKGFPYARKIFLRLGGGIRKFYGSDMENEILDSIDQNENNQYKKLVPEHAKRVLAEKLHTGPYPIVRNYAIISPYNSHEYNVTEYIYYMKKTDILFGIFLPSPDSIWKGEKTNKIEI